MEKKIVLSLKQKIQSEIKKAMKQKDRLMVSVLRMLSASILNREKEKRAKLSKSGTSEKLDELSQLTDQEILEAVASEVKKRKDAIEQFQQGGRQDLAQKEEAELKILNQYLPEQLSEEEVRKIVKKEIEQLGVGDLKEAGRVMSSLMPQLKGKADGALVGKIVQEELRR